MKITPFILVIFIILTLITIPIRALPYIEPSLIEKIEKNESVNGIVKLKDGHLETIVLNKDNFEAYIKDDSTNKIFTNYPIAVSLYDTVKIINASNVWPLQINTFNLTGKGQSICVVDTGVNYKHSDLGGCFGQNCKVIAGHDFVNNDSNPEDDNGHGTYIAGIVAANGNLKGVAPEANIIAVKVLDSKGEGYSSDVINGIDWCVNHSKEYNISSIVLSLSTNCLLNPSSCSSEYCSPSQFEDSVNEAYSKNIAVLAASGNSGLRNLLPSPACVKNVIPIGASDKEDNFWPNSNLNPSIKILAPGKDVYSAYLNDYQTLSGTSAAVPHIAGAIAIINQLLTYSNQTKTLEEIDFLLYQSGHKIEIENYSLSRLDLLNAILEINPSFNITTNQPSINSAQPTSHHRSGGGGGTSKIIKNLTSNKKEIVNPYSAINNKNEKDIFLAESPDKNINEKNNAGLITGAAIKESRKTKNDILYGFLIIIILLVTNIYLNKYIKNK